MQVDGYLDHDQYLHAWHSVPSAVALRVPQHMGSVLHTHALHAWCKQFGGPYVLAVYDHHGSVCDSSS